MNAPSRSPNLLLLCLAMLLCGAPEIFAGNQAGATSATPLKIHPKVFSLVQGWLSDGASPVVTEINLDAVAESGNQFDSDSVKQEDGWTRCPAPDGGFLRYRVLEMKGGRGRVEFQENGGGSLTTAATIEFTIEKRELGVNGAPKTVRVLRVNSYRVKAER